jgi:hypothetical protein
MYQKWGRVGKHMSVDRVGAIEYSLFSSMGVSDLFDELRVHALGN